MGRTIVTNILIVITIVAIIAAELLLPEKVFCEVFTPTTQTELLVNITTKDPNGNIINPATITYEWLFMVPTIGGNDLGLFLYTTDGFKDYDTIFDNDPTLVSAAYDFDHTSDTFSLGVYSLGNDLGMLPGDSLMYGYAYTLTDTSELVIGNVVTLYIKENQYTALGSYDYNSGSQMLTVIFTSSDFYCNGPGLGAEQWNVLSLTPTNMIWLDEDGDQLVWSRNDGQSGDITGIWHLSNDEGIYEANFMSDGNLKVSGIVLECGNPGKLGIYSPDFEFEMEYLFPLNPGIYYVGSDFEAIVFENNFTPYNLHAYGGIVVITSTSPNYEGSFFLTDFAADHGEIPSLSGDVSGAFSVPLDGGNGFFVAAGSVDGYEIQITAINAIIGGAPQVY